MACRCPPVPVRVHGLPVSGDARLCRMVGLPGTEGFAKGGRPSSRHRSRRRMRGGGLRGLRPRDPALPRLRDLPRRRRRHHRQLRRERPRGRRQSSRRHPVPARAVPHRDHPVHRPVLAGRDGRDRPLHHRGIRVSVRARPAGARTLARRPAEAIPRSHNRGRAQTQVTPQAAEDRAGHREGRAEREGGAGETGTAVRARSRSRNAAASCSPRRAQEAAEARRGRIPGGNLSSGRAQACRFRHRSGSGRGASRSRRHPLRAAAGPGTEGEPGDQSRQGSRTVALDRERAHRGGHPRKDHHRTGNPERRAGGRRAERRAQVQPVRHRRVPSGAWSGKGHLGTAGRGGSCEHAPPARGRDHRFGQVRRHQRDDSESALQGVQLRRADDHDRSEDAGALGVRGHPASSRAGGDRHEARIERAALVRGRDWTGGTG